ncbi:MAG: sugar ABC transporter substrate-binding protein [Dorea sp.]|jgi:ABC-type sugar transport system substrate-binding protein|nr:sugar ABC transporter substrate-binding protein [Dorea sp.]
MKSSNKMFILTEAVLAVMVIITVFGMLWGKNGERQRRVSVIVKGSDDTRWAAFKYGLRMAAQDEGIALFIASMGEDLTAEEEIEAIEREIDNGADAVIVQPVSGGDTQKMLKKIEKRVPVILVEDTAAGGKKGVDISAVKPDDYAVGQTLAEELLKDYSGNIRGKTLGFVSKYGDSEAVQERKKGIVSVLEDTGVKAAWEVANFSRDEGDIVLEQKSKVDFVVALDDYSLVLAGKAAASNNLHGALVYGIGNSMEAVYCLDSDYAQCLIVPDDFDMGYQSMLEASKSFGHLIRRTESRTINYTIMRKKDLFTKENQKVLFTMGQ